MSRNLEYRTRGRQRKRESRPQESEAQREKGREIKKKTKETFFCWKINLKLCSGGDKTRNASGDQCKVKMSGREKKN